MVEAEELDEQIHLRGKKLDDRLLESDICLR